MESVIVISIIFVGFIYFKHKYDVEMEKAREEIQRQKFTRNAIANDLRILQETVDIINSSKNLETVLSRFNVMETVLKRLIGYKQQGYEVYVEDIYNFYNNIDSEKKKFIKELIDDVLKKELIKTKELKTEKGKINKLRKIIEKLVVKKSLISKKLFDIDIIIKDIEILIKNFQIKLLIDKMLKFQNKKNIIKMNEYLNELYVFYKREIGNQQELLLIKKILEENDDKKIPENFFYNIAVKDFGYFNSEHQVSIY